MNLAIVSVGTNKVSNSYKLSDQLMGWWNGPWDEMTYDGQILRPMDAIGGDCMLCELHLVTSCYGDNVPMWQSTTLARDFDFIFKLLDDQSFYNMPGTKHLPWMMEGKY